MMNFNEAKREIPSLGHFISVPDSFQVLGRNRKTQERFLKKRHGCLSSTSSLRKKLFIYRFKTKIDKHKKTGYITVRPQSVVTLG